MQKRRYQNGYYVDKQHTKQKSKSTADDVYVGKPETASPTRNSNINKAPQSVEISQPPPPVEAAAPETKEITDSVNLAIQNPVSTETKDSCDVVLMRSGEEIRAKVLEITEGEVKYKKCAMPDGPLYVARKSEVFMLKYTNGSKEVFPETLSTPTSPRQESQERINDYRTQNQQRTMHPDAVDAFLMGLLGLVYYGSIRAIVMGIGALRDIRKDPLAYKGEGFAIAGIVLGALKLLLVLGVIALILTALI